MPRPLNVLFLSSEVEPFAKTGGLADVSGALPQVIKQLGHEVRVMMPRYGSIKERSGKLHDIARLKDTPVPVNGTLFSASVKSSFLAGKADKVQVYFLDNEHLFGRTGLYVDPATGSDYSDNDDRFIFFARGVFEVLKRLGWQPDVIHCNDWPTGLVPAYLKTVYAHDRFFKDTKSVFTIHNMAYQGMFPPFVFPKTNLPMELFSEAGIVANGNLNFLKSGLVFADAITTVSKRYAQEIQSSPEFGCGLQDLVKKRSKDVFGILNGVDYAVWDPAVDPLLPCKYDATNLGLKKENTRALLQKMGLTYNEHIPVIGIISRLADQKGFDLIAPVLHDIMRMKVQMVVLGTGDRRYAEMFAAARMAFPEQLRVDLSFNNELAHLIEAGSDMFLMPSRYEPCGLNQIYSLRYGTVPIVRATGGLDDTIQDVDLFPEDGTGFKFAEYNSGALLHAIHRAVSAFTDRARWERIMKNGMSRDYSWEASAQRYVEVYKGIAKA
ncbi:MAG: glycogen synthase GlgA [Bacteroidota bacterium]